MNLSRRRTPWGVGALVAVAALLLALPLIGLVQRASWSTLVDDLTTTEARNALVLSIVVSLAATLACVVLGLPLAWVLARTRWAGRGVLRVLVLVPLVLPPVVGGIALLSAFGRRGLIGAPLGDVLGIQLTFTTAGAVLAATFVALPFFVLVAEAALRQVDTRYDEVAATLGASRWFTFRRVTLPMIAPGLAAGAVLAWARALGEFGATLTFAGNVEGETRTLPLAIYLELDTNASGAVALSLLLLAVAVVVVVALRGRWWNES